MSKQTLRAVTPVGTFTRNTETAYRFVSVWASPRAKADADRINADPEAYRGGVSGRWAKDQGYGVEWHFKAPTGRRSYKWDSSATLVGVFPVAQDSGEWEPVDNPDAWKEADAKLLAGKTTALQRKFRK